MPPSTKGIIRGHCQSPRILTNAPAHAHEAAHTPKAPQACKQEGVEDKGEDRALQDCCSPSRNSDGLPRRKEEQHCPKQSSMICLGVQTALGAVALNTRCTQLQQQRAHIVCTQHARHTQKRSTSQHVAPDVHTARTGGFFLQDPPRHSRGTTKPPNKRIRLTDATPLCHRAHTHAQSTHTRQQAADTQLCAAPQKPASTNQHA